MRIFIAGGSGVIGRALVPLMVADGHRVVALTRGNDRAAQLAAMGAEPVLGDIYDTEGLAGHLRQAHPDVVVHQLTAFGAKTHDPAADPLQETLRIRTEGTRSLVAAMQQTGVGRLITQSISFISSPDPAGLDAEGLSVEATPHFLEGGPAIKPLAQAVQTMEDLSLHTPGITGCVLRYGWFYGQGTNYDPAGPIVRGLRKGRSPLVRSATGLGQGVYSHIAVADAAQATLLALQRGAEGIFNIVDDTPAWHADWLGWLATRLRAPVPPALDEATARETYGAMLTHFMTAQRGASNTQARQALGWQPRWPDWRDGFQALFNPEPSP